MEWRQRQGLVLHVHLGHGARLKAVMVQLGVSAVVHRIQVRVDGAGGHFMKARFPHMDAGGIHQGHVCVAVFAELAAQAGDQRQTAGATTDNNNSGFAHWGSCRANPHGLPVNHIHLGGEQVRVKGASE